MQARSPFTCWGNHPMASWTRSRKNLSPHTSAGLVGGCGSLNPPHAHSHTCAHTRAYGLWTIKRLLPFVSLDIHELLYLHSVKINWTVQSPELCATRTERCVCFGQETDLVPRYGTVCNIFPFLFSFNQSADCKYLGFVCLFCLCMLITLIYGTITTIILASLFYCTTTSERRTRILLI